MLTMLRSGYTYLHKYGSTKSLIHFCDRYGIHANRKYVIYFFPAKGRNSERRPDLFVAVCADEDTRVSPHLAFPAAAADPICSSSSSIRRASDVLIN